MFELLLLGQHGRNQSMTIVTEIKRKLNIEIVLKITSNALYMQSKSKFTVLLLMMVTSIQTGLLFQSKGMFFIHKIMFIATNNTHTKQI